MHMHDPELEWMLRRWARCYGTPPPGEWDEGEGADSMLASMLRRARLGMIAANPDDSLWAPPADQRKNSSGRLLTCAPPSDRVTARGKESPPAPRRSYGDRVADGIDAAVMLLRRENVVRATVLRTEYLTRGPRREKVQWAGGWSGTRLTRKRYLWELDNSLIWLEPRVAHLRRDAA